MLAFPKQKETASDSRNNRNEKPRLKKINFVDEFLSLVTLMVAKLI